MNRITSIVVLGEKNHGKSTLIGRLLYETRSIPIDRLNDVKQTIKASGKRFEWAHLLDSFVYEREHKMTLDTTRAMVKFGTRFYEFIDVPGHKELIQNMLTGASDAKFAILIVDAKEGIKNQTLKHIEIAEFLGIKKIIAIINKMDMVGYSQTTFEKIKKDLKMDAVPVVAKDGTNLIKKSAKLKWFRGPTLQKTIENKFKISDWAKNKILLAKKAKNITAACLFIERPKKKLMLESRHGSYSISKLNGPKNINTVEKISIKLKKIGSISDKFVIKNNGRIISICKLS
ncbi:MAG: GTP-binding protein [bacterium]|nr:GTP-binding protein [bacterium]